MRRLSGEAFARARRFLMAEARPLERALFAHRFEGGPAEAVWAELAHYRNDDGGFGHGLEPDLRTPHSSALATSDALGTLQALGCPAEHALVRGAVQWLLAAYDERAAVWRVVPEGANDYAHAPWWHDEDGSLARTFDDFLVVPRTRIVALLYHYAGLLPAGWLDRLAERTVSEVMGMAPQALGGGGDSLRACLQLAQAHGLPERLRRRLLPWLRDVVAPAIVERDPARWPGYVPSPLKLARTPDSPLAAQFGDDLQRNLDYEIARQAPEGYWEPNWTWGDFYPDVWPQARQEWRGHLTLETLTSLRAYGRLER